MSNFIHSAHYRKGRRYLRTVWGRGDQRFYVSFRFSGSHDDLYGKGININWYNYSGTQPLAKQFGFARNLRAFVPFENEKRPFNTSYAVLTETGVVTRIPILIDGPPKITDCMSVARSLAAGKCPPEALSGWIEDNWPEPWSLLASPDPIALIRTLSPLPLLENA